MVMGELTQSADLVILGAGPGGYIAAIRAAQLGKKVLLVDRDNQLGGICLHHGCIPSKTLITAADLVHKLKEEGPSMGIKANPKVDYKKMQEWKQSVIDKLVGGIDSLLKAHKIEYVQGTANFQSSKRLRIVSGDSHRTIEFKHAIIATGSRPRELEGFTIDEKNIVTSTGSLKFAKIPKSLIVIGAGYIACELSSMYAKLGTKVTMLARGDKLLKFVPRDMGSILEHRMEELGVEILYNTPVKSAKVSKAGVEVKGEKKIFKAEKCLIAAGRVPNTDELGLNNTKVKLTDKSLIEVDEQQRTADSRIFAIGDVTKGPALAHKASTEGRVAAGVIAGLPDAFDQQVPAVIFTDPEIAYVGLSEVKAKEAGYEVAVGKFPFTSSGKALVMNATRGFVKIISDKKTNVIIGVYIIGPEACNLISEAALAIEMAATTEDLALTIHPHPTLPETLMEAAEAVKGRAIHLYQKS